MSEERLKEIKDSIDLQHDLLTIKGDRLELINEEIELYNEVVRLQKENEMLKLENKNNYETNQDIIYEMQEENKELAHLVANKVMLDYDYDSVLKKELNEERRRNIVLNESKSMTEKVLNEFEKWLKMASENIDFPKDDDDNVEYSKAQNVGYCFALKDCEEKLQELKGVNNEYR